jgi:hypothetical protein
MSFAGFGSFAGGLASGVMMGQRLHRDVQRQKQEEAEYQRQEGWRREAGNTLGSVGTQREDGSTYTEEDAYGDLSKLGAKYEPEKAMAARTAGLQLKTTKKQLAGLERQERYATQEEDVMSFLRNMQGAPDDHFYREASKFASRYGGDGKSFGVDFDANAGYSAVMIDTNSGEVFRQPINSRQEVERQLMSYASPQAMRAEQGLKQKDREFAQNERKLGQTDRQIGLLQQRVDQQGKLMESQGRAYDALAGQREQTGLSKLPEADKIYLKSLEDQKKNLQTLIAKAEDPTQAAALQVHFRKLLSSEYDMLKKHSLIPQGQTKTAYLGLPDPIQVASSAMQGARSEQEFRTSMEQFDQLYGDAPEAAEARNAMQVFMQNQFYSRVRPQSQGLVQQMGAPFSGPHMTPEMGLRVRQAAPYGIGKFN